MAYVKDNLVRSAVGLKGAYTEVTVSGSKVTFDTGFSTINHATWKSTAGSGGGYDFIDRNKAPHYNDVWFNIPTFSDGVFELTGSLITDGTKVKIWAVGE